MRLHTQGPWQVDGATTPGKLGRRYHEITSIGAGRPYPCIAHTADRDHTIGNGEDEANAQLLGASPDLADALSFLMEVVHLLPHALIPFELSVRFEEAERMADEALEKGFGINYKRGGEL